MSTAAAAGVDKAMVDGLTDKGAQGGGGTDVAKIAQELGEMRVKLSRLEEEKKLLETSVKEYTPIVQAVKVAFGKDTIDPKVADANFLQLLRTAGYSEQEAQAALQARQAGDEPEEPKGGKGKEREEEDKGRGEPSTELRALMDLQQRQLVTSLKRESRSAVEGDPTLKAALKFIEERDGKEAAKVILDGWADEAHRMSRTAFKAEIDRVGYIDPEWLDVGPKKVVKELAGKVQQLLGDPKSLGKMRPITAGEDPLAGLERTEPVPAPRWKPEAAPGAVEEGAKRMLNDSLLRSLQKLRQGQASNI